MNRWPRSRTFFWEEAPFFRLLLTLILAIIAYDRGLLPAVTERLLLLVASSSILLVVLAFSRWASLPLGGRLGAGSLPGRVGAGSFLINVSLFLLGWTVCVISGIQSDPSWYGNSLTTAEAYAVRVVDPPREKEKTFKLKVKVLKSLQRAAFLNTTGNALLYVYKDSFPFNIHRGDILLLPNKWLPITNPGNPYEFDYASFCRRNNLYHQQFLSRAGVAIVKANTVTASAVASSHDWGMATLGKYIKDTATLGIMQAMLIGDDINFDEDLRQSYGDTGIIHIIAISGSHISTFFFITTAFFFWMKKRKHQWIKYAFAIPLIWFYVMIAGMPSSAVRAAVMFTLIGLGLAFSKNQNSLNQIFAAAFLMLLIEPNWLFSIGFQLSFVAVLSLILFYQRMSSLLYPSNFILRKLWQCAAASVAAEILVAPIVIYYFHLLPAAFLVSNLAAYLFMGVTLILGILLVALSPFTILGKWLAMVITLLVDFFNAIILFLQKANPPSFKLLYLSLPQLFFVYVFVAGMSVYIFRKSSKALITSLVGASVFLLLLCFKNWNVLHQEKLVVYNVSKLNYAEYISGDICQSLRSAGGTISGKKLAYATKEAHINWGIVASAPPQSKELFSVAGKKLLVLNEPLNSSPTSFENIDYLLINYPLKGFDALHLQNAFHFTKLIVGSNQRRYVAEAWKDSCLKHRIPAHFTLLEGAFVYSND
jgi:competence protein ComEC